MSLRLYPREIKQPLQLVWALPSSKSLLARRILLCCLEQQGELPPLQLHVDTPEDIHSLYTALLAHRQRSPRINVGASGTAMRFLTAYLAACTDYTLRLEGTDRQHARPIAPLVQALRSTGARIDYLEYEGYPPLLIHPATLHPAQIELDASESSQYLSALLLLAPKLPSGTCIQLGAKPLVSESYAAMTCSVLAEAGYRWEQRGSAYHYLGYEVPQHSLALDEADWSAASYAYAFTALLPQGSSCLLKGLHYPSLQGDSAALVSCCQQLGVITELQHDGVLLRHCSESRTQHLAYNFSSSPDLVPTFVVLAVCLGLSFHYTGVAHLRLKESDRLAALATELTKLGFELELETDSISYRGGQPVPLPSSLPTLETYRDHRMAMSFALLGLVYPGLAIEAPSVVGKSYPNYWEQLKPIYQLVLEPEANPD